MFTRNLLLFFMLLYTSVIFPKSSVIITGDSSLIIESASNTTKLIAGKIVRLSGGKLVKEIIEDTNSEKLSDQGVVIDTSLPTVFAIEKAYPNPFNPTTRIRYGISTTSLVNFAIYDMTGRLVSDNTLGNKEPGWHEFIWQGTDSHGQQVSTGIYLVTMRAGEHIQKQKVTLLK